MTVHSTLKSKFLAVGHRNVLTRTERIEKLKEQEKWQDGQSVLGLPKVRSIKMKRKAKPKKEAAAVPGAAAAPAGAAPAPAATPAKKAK